MPKRQAIAPTLNGQGFDATNTLLGSSRTSYSFVSSVSFAVLKPAHLVHRSVEIPSTKSRERQNVRASSSAIVLCPTPPRTSASSTRTSAFVVSRHTRRRGTSQRAFQLALFFFGALGNQRRSADRGGRHEERRQQPNRGTSRRNDSKFDRPSSARCQATHRQIGHRQKQQPLAAQGHCHPRRYALGRILHGGQPAKVQRKSHGRAGERDGEDHRRTQSVVARSGPSGQSALQPQRQRRQ